MSSELMNFLLSYTTRALSLFISLFIISIIPFNYFSIFDNKHSMLMFFILSSLNVYFILMIGWSANSKYSHIGAIRSVAQMISYEVSFFLIILFIVLLSNSYHFTQISDSQKLFFFFYGNMALFTIWLVSCLAETNRSPFDFAEGESELVSGFNVEYMGGWFALIFLAEYMSMIILSMISTIMFFKSMNTLISLFLLMFISLSLIWVRGTLPRFCYDLLMNLSWKIFFPTTLYLISLSLITSFYSY